MINRFPPETVFLCHSLYVIARNEATKQSQFCHSALDAESISSAFHTVVIARSVATWQSHLSSVQVFQLQSWNVSKTQKLNPNKP